MCPENERVKVEVEPLLNSQTELEICREVPQQQSISSSDGSSNLYRCAYCPRKFEAALDVARHVRCDHVELPKPFSCKYPGCERAFKCPDTRTNHHRRHRINENLFNLSQFASGAAYNNNAAANNNAADNAQVRPPAAVAAASAAVAAAAAAAAGNGENLPPVSQNIPATVGTGRGEGNKRCDRCGGQFRDAEALDRHVRLLHFRETEKNIPCEHVGCGKMFASTSNMGRHFRTHMKTFPCKFHPCPEVFYTFYQRMAHYAGHEKEEKERIEQEKRDFHHSIYLQGYHAALAEVKRSMNGPPTQN